jgi:hypothetical protein
VAVLIAVGLLSATLFNFDSMPFWLFFNVWQLFTHIPLLNLKIPGFISVYWQQQLNIWTLRNDNIYNMMVQFTSESSYN